MSAPRLTAAQRRALEVATSLPASKVPQLVEHKAMLDVIGRGLMVTRSARGGPSWALTEVGRAALEAKSHE